MASLAGKVITITGAASGMGLALARIAGSRGAKLALADVQQDKLDSAVSELRSQNIEVVGQKVDVTSFQEVDHWIKSVVQHYGRLDGSANLAGVVGKGPLGYFKDLHAQPLEDWDYIISVNLTGTMYCMHSELAVMEKGASIVNAASTLSLEGKPGMSAYTASKHGVLGLTRSVGREYGPRGIRINCVAPGAIETPMLRKVFSVEGERSTETAPLHRNGEPEEVAKVIVFLLSDDASFVHGAIYPVDGGETS